MKNNVAKSFIRKILTVSHSDFHPENKKRIFSVLEKNNFPVKVIQKLYNEVVNARLNVSNINVTEVTEEQRQRTKRKSYPFLPDETTVNVSNPNKEPGKFSGMTYIPKLTEELTSQIKYFVPDVKIAPRPPNKLGQFYSKMKQPVPKDEMSGVVYDIPCQQLDTRYIGETVQKVGNRTGQHRNDCTAANLKKRTKNRTALACHVKETGHQFNFEMEHVKILKRERNKTRLRIQEVNEIIMNEGQVCNFKSDSAIIGPAYGRLLKQFKLKKSNQHNNRTIQRQRTHSSQGFNID